MDFGVPKELWKVTINPTGKKEPNADPFEFCKEKGVVGIGWGLNPETRNKQEAMKLFREKYSSPKTAFNAIVNRMEIGDHVWTYRKKKYYVCRIKSDWEPRNGGEWLDNDIRNVREAEWRVVSPGLIPGKIERGINSRGAAQRIKASKELKRYSAWVFENNFSIGEIVEKLNYQEIRKMLEKPNIPSVFSDVFDPDDTEDLIGLFLQKELGWSMVKSSIYKNKPVFECELLRKKSNQVSGVEMAYMQVKSGHVSIDLIEYEDFTSDSEFVYLFSASDNPYVNKNLENNRLVALEKEAIHQFLIDNLETIPLPIIIRLGIWGGVL